MKKTVVVTGASSGIGKAIYDHYKQSEDYDVIGISRHGPDLKMDLSKHIQDFDERTLVPPVLEDVDILINCAGIMLFDEVEKIFNVNFWAPYMLIENLMNPGMVVINIASVAGLHAEPEFPLYAASKAALISLTASLAKKYAKIGARINCISPGFMKSNLVDGETPEDLLLNIPMEREADAAEILPVVKMLETCEYMTGSNVVIDGGLSC